MSFKPDTFHGKVALVTGGTSGIGAGTARYLASLGAEVLAVGLDPDGDASPRGDRIRTLELDVTDEAAFQRAIDGLERLDILVNCAGISLGDDEYAGPGWDRVVGINLTAVMRGTQLAISRLRQSRGAVINIASMYSIFGARERPAYAASKGAIVQLTKSLAQAYAEDGVRVNAVAPGWINTALGDSIDDATRDAITRRTPFKRWGEAEEVASVIAFLASDAAGFVTGSVIPVDGGYSTV